MGLFDAIKNVAADVIFGDGLSEERVEMYAEKMIKDCKLDSNDEDAKTIRNAMHSRAAGVRQDTAIAKQSFKNKF